MNVHRLRNGRKRTKSEGRLTLPKFKISVGDAESLASEKNTTRKSLTETSLNHKRAFQNDENVTVA